MTKRIESSDGWNPTQPPQWPPLWISAFPRLIGTAAAFSGLWILLIGPLGYGYDGFEGVKIVLYVAPFIGAATFYYEWYVPLSVWRSRLSNPPILFKSLTAGGATLLLLTPVAFVLGGDRAVFFVVGWAFLVTTATLLGMRAWTIVVTTVLAVWVGLMWALIPNLFGSGARVTRPASSPHVLRVAIMTALFAGAYQGLQDGYQEAMGSQKRESLRDILGCATILFVVLGLPASVIVFMKGSYGLLARTLSGTLLGCFVAFPLGYLLFRECGSSLAAFVAVNTNIMFVILGYLRERAAAVFAFVSGYVLITFWYACAYNLLWLGNTRCFGGVAAGASLVEFWYFSIITLATVGYGDITPACRGARLLVSSEILIGIVWTTVVVTGIVGISNRRLSKDVTDGDERRAHQRRSRVR